MTDHKMIAARLEAALLAWRGLMAQPADVDDDAHAEAVDTALERANALAGAILALPTPTAADLPAVALAFAWRAAGGIPSAEDDPEMHEAARRLIAAFKAQPSAATLEAA